MSTEKVETVKTLEQIKNEVAIERYPDFEGWIELDLVEERENWPEVCRRYASECVKASLKKAADKARTEKVRDYSLERPQVIDIRVKKSTITDDSNIILL